MKFMEKAKRFFTLSAKHEGFTLVELIVVIAILAILAGVAIPAYSGYIKKAEKAGDLTLLAAVNDAFAASCMMDNKSTVEIKGAALDWSDNKVVGIASISGANLNTVQEAFDMFYGDNKSAEFKVIKKSDLVFVPGVGFVEFSNIPKDTASYSVSFAGGVIRVTTDNKNALSNSAFYQNQGTEEILGTVDSVANIAAGLSGPGYDAIKNSTAFTSTFANALGIKPEEFEAKAKEMAEASLKAQGKEVTGTNMQAEIDKFTANAMVLYTAELSAGMTAQQAQDMMKDIDVAKISTNMQNGDANGLTQAALACGMYLAYVNSDACTDTSLKGSDVNIVNVSTALNNNSEFQSYIQSEQGAKDLEGYLAAMQMIDSTTKTENNSTAVESLIVNGFNTDELTGVLTGIMGK